MSYPEIKKYCEDHHVTLIAVSKTKTSEEILTIYKEGQKIFGENKVQELLTKSVELPRDIHWHLIGHLQSNKVKQIIPAVTLIHSVDSKKLLTEINDQAQKINRSVDVLIQIHIATEETKLGLSYKEAATILTDKELKNLKSVRLRGLMGMASFTEDENRIRTEFRSLKKFYDEIKSQIPDMDFNILSMGMSSDYKIAVEEGSNMVRIGSAIFGARQPLTFQ